MEKIVKIQEKIERRKIRAKFDIACFAILCIALGLVFVGRNTGLINESLFSVLISWQMLLVVIGLYSISHRGYKSGVFIVGVGLFFMMPIITGAGKEWVSVYWPLIFVFVGLMALVKLLMPRKKDDCYHFRLQGHYFSNENYKTESGFVHSHNSFSSTKHIVMDELFKGAKIINHFGGTVLDLRRTTLQQGDTFIDIDSFCGGLEIFLPDDWLVLTELNSFMSGVEDDRHKVGKVDENNRLILRGKISMSGIELKN